MQRLACLTAFSKPHIFLQISCARLLQQLTSMFWNKKKIRRFPAHDELGACRTSLVHLKQPVLYIPVRPTHDNTIILTIMLSLQLDLGQPGGRSPLDFTKQKLCGQSIVWHPQSKRTI